jgi:integrase
VSSNSGRPSGFIRIVRLASGEAFYAQMRTADGRRLQRRLGRVWSKRSRPAAGYLTRAQAEARLQAMLDGKDESVPVEAPPEVMPTFAAVGREWLDYIEHDRKRRRSTVQDYRRELERVLIPAFGENTPLREIDTARIDAYRARLVAEDRLSARTINKRLAQLHAIFKRAQRVHGLAVNPVALAERQPYRPSGDFSALTAAEVAALAANAANAQDAALFKVAAFTGLRLGELRGLRWGDVDWMRRLLHVRRSFTRGETGPPKWARFARSHW